jgi:hypothetical protein
MNERRSRGSGAGWRRREVLRPAAARCVPRRRGGERLGFDHRTLEPHRRHAFGIVEKRHIFFQVLYVLARRPASR